MAVKLTNTSKFLKSQGETHWWEWTAFLEGEEEELDAICYVEYHLHTTFPNPITRIKKRRNGFPLTRKGWGVFELKAKVVFKDNVQKPKFLKHFLAFE